MMVDSAALKWEPEPLPELVPPPPRLVALPEPDLLQLPDEGGAVLVVLGDGPDGLHREAREVYLLERDELLDIVGHDPRRPTTFEAQERGIKLVEIGDVDGVFARIDRAVPLRHGDLFRVGMTRLRFEGARTQEGHDVWGSLVRLRDDGWPGERFEVRGLGTTVGRSRGDVVLSHDPFLSHRHCRVVADSTGVYLDDLGSDNGTFRMVRPGEVLPYGTTLRIGDGTLRVDPMP